MNELLPFRFEKVEDFGPDWIPELGVEYFVELKPVTPESKSRFRIGSFSKTRKGLYHFRCGLLSEQLSMTQGPNPDYKRFLNVWRFYREPSFAGFISDKDMEL